MANVFGTVIDNAYVKKLPDYIHKDVITPKDRARVALTQQNSRGYNIDATNYVKQLKEQTEVSVCTLIILYNATGNPIEHVTDHDWYGKIGGAPYPQRLENGQWAGFLHQKKTFGGSNGAIVYRCIDVDNTICDTAIAWDTPSIAHGNKAYTEIHAKDHFKKENDRWGVVNDKMSNGGYTCDDVTTTGLISHVSTSSGDKPEYVATLSLGA